MIAAKPSGRPAASLSLDLDNKWAYLRAAGRRDWDQAVSYLPVACGRIAEILGKHNLPLTVFLVGRDLVRDEDLAAIEPLRTLRQFEPANHSLSHLPWMHTMSADEVAREIEQPHEAIREHFGVAPRGFRGPGFSCPPAVIKQLKQHDYVYDASVFPTSMAPMARTVFLIRSGLRGKQKDDAKQLYGGFASMRQPNRPFVRDGLVEIPVTVMPVTRAPIHFSYVTFLASFSIAAAKSYFTASLAACRRTGTPPSLLLHPPDFLGRQDDADMAYFPGMKMDRNAKLGFIDWALDKFARQFQVDCLLTQAHRFLHSTGVAQP